MPNIPYWLHMQYRKLFSSYKFRQCGFRPGKSLNHEEREFLLALGFAFHGNDIVVYDIGAHRGVVASALAKLENVRSVHAFEPIPRSFQRLVGEVRTEPKVVCHKVALGSENRMGRLHVSAEAASSSLLPMAASHRSEFPGTGDAVEIDVEIARLDDFILRQQLPLPDVLKIDVQGFELDVLEGGLSALKRARFCVVEMSFIPLYDGSPVFDDIYRFLTGQGFVLRGAGPVTVGRSLVPLQIDGIFERAALIDDGPKTQSSTIVS
jgi:FkbM family methyltransferase